MKPELQQAVKQISQAVEAAPLASAASTTLVNLARSVRDGPTVTDVASVAWRDLRHVVPGASCGYPKLTLTWPRSTGLRMAG